jgi:ABC-type antimicrobial peptide transport system permease subunit
MNENEKNLFYHVLNKQITEEPTPELAVNIMHIIHQKVHKKMILHKTLVIFGYALLGALALGFVAWYLFFYAGFSLPVIRFNFEMPSKVYIITASIIFVLALIQLSFRKRLYENN